MTGHRLKSELDTLLQDDPQVFEFLGGASLDGLWFWDLEQPEHEWMSDNFWLTLGYDPDTKQHLASEWQDIVNSDDLKLVFDNFEKHCADPNHPYDQIVRYQHRNGSTVWLRCQGLAIRDGQGKPIRMLCVHNDITALKRTELELKQTLKNRERFFARMSHEIRTPLHGMMGIGELLQSNVTNSDNLKKLDTLMSCGRELQSLLNDLLTLAKIEDDRFNVYVEDVSLASIFDFIESLFRGRAEQKNLSFDISKQDCDGWIVRSDPVRLTQILSNLLSNAINYTRNGSIAVSVDDQDDQLTLIIADTGEGIADVSAALRACNQQSQSFYAHSQGPGLGLEIVDKLCKVLEHQLEIVSEVGKGTRVMIKVQKAEFANLPSQQQLAELAEQIDVSNLVVLLVDDNDINRLVAKSMIEDRVARVDEAQDGDEAVAMFIQNGGYDVVLMDLNMPVKNGFDATKEIKSLPEIGAQSRVIALSADALETTIKQCRHTGMCGHVAKPFTRDVLLEAVAGF